MDRASRWWFLNPLEWLKIAYETFGAKHPIGSLSVVMVWVLCWLAQFGLWVLNSTVKVTQRRLFQHPQRIPRQDRKVRSCR